VIGQLALARTILADLIDKLDAKWARRSASKWLFPEPPTHGRSQRRSLFWGSFFFFFPEALAKHQSRKSRSFPTNESGVRLRRSLSKAPVALGSYRVPASHTIPRNQRRYRFGGDESYLPLTCRIIPAPQQKPQRAARQGQGAGSLNCDPRGTIQISAALPMLVRIGDMFIPSLPADQLRLHKGQASYFVKRSGASGEKSFGAKTGIVGIKVAFSRSQPGGQWIRCGSGSRPRQRNATLPGPIIRC
jgi:adenylate cyclase